MTTETKQMTSEKEKWGCWNGSDEVVSVIEETKEGAIEAYANDYLSYELGETFTGEAEAVVSLGAPVLVENYTPSFLDFQEHIENSVADDCSIEDPIIQMTKEEELIAEESYKRMIAEFTAKYIKQRDWNVFDSSEHILIEFHHGKYKGWRTRQ